MSPSALSVVRVAKLQSQPQQHRWLIEHLWAEEAVGCIGGTPKSFKTWMALEMAVAVASGTPCLGRFKVPVRGHVLVYAAEDPPHAIRERVAGIAQARNLNFARLAVGLITEPALRLDQVEDRARLNATLEQFKPRLLVLDPLVRLHRCNENHAAEISELLGYLRELQRRHHVAIVLVHHVRKSSASQPGQALRGSGDLHAWGDSNLYLLRAKGKLVLHAEHRANPAPAPLAVALQTQPARLVVSDLNEDDSASKLEKRVLEALAQEPMGRNRLRAALRVRNESLGGALERLKAAGRITYVGDGWVVPSS